MKHPVCKSHVECAGSPRNLARDTCPKSRWANLAESSARWAFRFKQTPPKVMKKGSWQEGLATRMRGLAGAFWIILELFGSYQSMRGPLVALRFQSPRHGRRSAEGLSPDSSGVRRSLHGSLSILS